MIPNQEQIKSGVRWVLSTFGGLLTGFVVGRGWFSAEQVTSFLTSELVIGGLASLAALIWSMVVKTKPNLVAATEALPGVQGVITSPTAEGREIAAAVPSDNVVVAGTKPAADMAKVA